MKKNIRKAMSLLLCAALSAGLTGCGSAQTSAGTESAAVTEAIAETTAGGEAAGTETTGSQERAEADAETINLYFVRHGKTILNTLDRVQGWSDSPLTEAGADAAKNTAYGLTDIPFDLAYSSDRMRAIETAGIILDANPASRTLAINKAEGLREHNYGKYEGDFNAAMWGDILAHLGLKEMDELFKMEDMTRHIYDSVAELDETGVAETYDEVAARLMASVTDIVRDAADQNARHVLVVGHGGAIGVILDQMGRGGTGELGNASVSLVEYTDGAYQVVSVGDMSYCEKGEAVRKSLPPAPEKAPAAVAEGEERGEVIIYLTRHGKTVFNTMGRTQGWVDSPLTGAGVEVAQNLGRGIADVEFAAAYSSDMGRAVETARIVLDLNNKGANVTLIQNPGLRETNYGKFESGINTDMLNAALDELGLSGMEALNDLDNGIAKVTDAIHKLDETGAAEDYQTMSGRVRDAVDSISRETAVNGGGNVLVVAHGNAIISFLNSIDDVNVLEIENASVSKIRYHNGTYTIESVNDTSYAEAGSKGLK